MWPFRQVTDEDRLVQVRAEVRAWEEVWSKRPVFPWEAVYRYEQLLAQKYALEMKLGHDQN